MKPLPVQPPQIEFVLLVPLVAFVLGIPILQTVPLHVQQGHMRLAVLVRLQQTKYAQIVLLVVFALETLILPTAHIAKQGQLKQVPVQVLLIQFA